MLIAVDFDGTIVENAFPKIGRPLPGALETLRDLVAAGHELILWTCRENDRYAGEEGLGYFETEEEHDYLTAAYEFLVSNGVVISAVNETPRNREFRPQGGRKVYCDLFIDDRNFGGFPGWDVIRKAILEDGA